jgi:hypothetical protein
MEVHLKASELVRASYNALLWVGKSAPWDVAYVVLLPEFVTIVTSDSYAVTEAEATVESHQGTHSRLVRISSDALKVIEKRARDTKGLISLKATNDALIYADEKAGEDLEFPDEFEESEYDEEESWDEINIRAFSDLLRERMEATDTHVFMVNPAYLRKFSMTKKDHPDDCADVWARGSDPILVKIGKTRTALQTIDRERNAEALGEDKQW